MLGRDNSGSEWRIECNSSVGRTVALPDLARDPSQAVKTDPNNILLCQVSHNCLVFCFLSPINFPDLVNVR